MDPFYTILLVAFLVSLIITIFNKMLIDQNLMKELKKDIKKYQAELKKK